MNQNTENTKSAAAIGEVQISSDVVAVVAAIAATEVKGVASMAGNITNELIGRLGVKNLSKGVKIVMNEGIVWVDIALHVRYGYSIPAVCRQVQEKVKAAIETMTGLQVDTVDVRIAGVQIENGEKYD